jgi:hypothetical protein
MSCSAVLRLCREWDPAAISSALPVRPARVAPVLPEGQREVPMAEPPFVIIETWIGYRFDPGL